MSGHHVPNLKDLLAVAAALIVLTFITVGAHYLHLPKTIAIVVSLAIAAVKATLVGAIFMGLYYDKKLNTLTFITSLIFLTIMVGITMSDTMFRQDPIPTFTF